MGLGAGNEGEGPHPPVTGFSCHQESLGGNAKTSLVIAVANAVQHADETLQSLQFGSRAMRVATQARVNEQLDYKARALPLMHAWWHAVMSLRCRHAGCSPGACMHAVATAHLPYEGSIGPRWCTTATETGSRVQGTGYCAMHAVLSSRSCDVLVAGCMQGRDLSAGICAIRFLSLQHLAPVAQVMNAELLAALDSKEDGRHELEASLAAREEQLAALGTAQRVRAEAYLPGPGLGHGRALSARPAVQHRRRMRPAALAHGRGAVPGTGACSPAGALPWRAPLRSSGGAERQMAARLSV